MDQKRLRQYRSLQREIKQLERQIGKLRAAKDKPAGYMVMDSVQASCREHPYQRYRASIMGWVSDLPPAERDREIASLEAELREAKRRCQIESWLIRRYINSRPNEEDRQLLRMYYIEGLSQQEIADEMGYTRAAIGKKLQKAVL